MKNSIKAFIAFVLAFMMMQGVYAAPGVIIKPDELRGGSVASGNMTPIVRVTPKPERVRPTPTPTPTPEPLYSDVVESDWFYPAVKAVTEKKYMDGTNDEGDEDLTFEPDKKLTRGMFVTILYRLAGSPAVSKATPKPTATPKPDDKSTATPKATQKPGKSSTAFTDVKDDMWYSDAVAWATASEIADGTSDDKFSPKKNITREQAVAMLYRYAKYKKADTSREANLLKYKDYAKIDEYAIDAFSWACGMGIIDGVGESKKLEPGSGMTRAQVAKMIATYTGDMPKATEKPKATDKPDAKATATPAPGSTAAPAATPAPGSTAAPTATPAPGSTAAPKATPAPGSTAAPTATPAPGSTAAPATTPTPPPAK